METHVWQKIRREIPTRHDILELRRIENTVERGTPDVWFAHVCGTSGWIELKYHKNIGRKPCTTWLFEDEQQIFMRHCHNKHVPHYLLCVWEDKEGGQDWYLLRTQTALADGWTNLTWAEANKHNLFMGHQFDKEQFISQLAQPATIVSPYAFIDGDAIMGN